MEVFDALRTRSSVRDYLPDPLTPAELERLQEAALLSPTSLNLQEQLFYFITDPAILDRIAQGMVEVSKEREEWDYLDRLRQRDGKVFFGAPALIIIAANEVNNYTDVDAGIAAQSLCLAAKSLGLDSVIMAAPDRVFTGAREPEYNALIGIPQGYHFAIAVAVGHAAKPFPPHTPKDSSLFLLTK